MHVAFKKRMMLKDDFYEKLNVLLKIKLITITFQLLLYFP